jgi:hypothetical protein
MRSRSGVVLGSVVSVDVAGVSGLVLGVSLATGVVRLICAGWLPQGEGVRLERIASLESGVTVGGCP